MAPLALPLVGGLVKLGEKLIDSLLPNPEAKAAALMKLRELDLKAMAIEAGLLQAQMEVNKEEAKHVSLFVAGWRPFCGWVCGSALAYHFIVLPLMTFLITVYQWEVPPLPVFDMGTLMTVLLGMLGIGGLRSFEKVKKVAR